MAQYFTGRKKLAEQFEIEISDRKKVLCTVFAMWEDIPGYECACNQNRKITIEKSWGISKKDSDTIESTLKSSLGVEGVVSLKSEIKGTTSHEVEWTYHETQTEEYRCIAPKCGCNEVRVAQLVYVYELVCYERGLIFHRGVWDRQWAKSIPERTLRISSWDSKTEYDPRCKDCPPGDVRLFDGRLSIDFGPLCVHPPYTMDKNELRIRMGRAEISYPMLSYHNTAHALEQDGLVMTFPREVIDQPLLFLSEIKGEEFEGNVRAYADRGTGRATFQAPLDLQKLTIASSYVETSREQ